jgi:tetratricopeptide (TPR) repeat protein
VKPELLQLLETGFAAQQGGDLALAERNYRQILANEPGNEFALNLLGVVLIRSQRPAEAVDALERALEVSESDCETHANLGLAYVGMDNYADAIRAFRRSLELRPAQPQVLNNLGNALAAVDKHQEAIACFKAALAFDGRFADCLNNLARSCLETLSIDEALQNVSQALQLEPGRADYLNTRGEVLLREARVQEARTCFEEAIAADKNTKALLNLSTALKQLAEYGDAELALCNVLEREPNNAEAHHHLGVLREQLGDSTAAAACYRQALACNPKHTIAYYQLAKLHSVTLSERELQQIHSLLNDDSLLMVLRAPLYFALGCASEKAANYSASIDYFAQAQAIKAARNPYDPAVVGAYFERCQSMDWPSSPAAPLPGDPVPVFVIGMPRSGTTLTEQILTSHSAIEGAGEVGYINELARLASNKTKTPFPECTTGLGPELVRELREFYFAKMRERCGSSDFVVDKNPLNYNFAGFICSVFPDAKLLYCLRDPIDTCVSIFRLPFDDNQGYSHDLASLGHYYRAHERIMALWRRHYPQQILTVRYADTVNDLAAQARRILDFLDLTFEEAVLSYYENERAVLTPSTEQVRRPIYRSSSNYEQRYKSAISPLTKALVDADV